MNSYHCSITRMYSAYFIISPYHHPAGAQYNNNFYIHVKAMEIWFPKQASAWRLGRCVPSQVKESRNKSLFYGFYSFIKVSLLSLSLSPSSFQHLKCIIVTGIETNSFLVVDSWVWWKCIIFRQARAKMPKMRRKIVHVSEIRKNLNNNIQM